MRSGVRIRDIVEGEGSQVLPRGKVVVNVRYFLNHGSELADVAHRGRRIVIDLKRRDCIAGLRYGIEGMRVGGQREIFISPHLAYGAKGVPGLIPPNALIRCEVELIDVRETDDQRVDDDLGKHLLLFHPGEASRNLPRWQFSMDEDGRGAIVITSPHQIPEFAWKRPRQCIKQTQFDSETARSYFESAAKLRDLYPLDCFLQNELIADMTEPGNSITRHKVSKVLCLTVGVSQVGRYSGYVALAENSPAMIEVPMLKVIRTLIAEMNTNCEKSN